ncbi:MAG: DedA family protein [Epsilonproteobacteria bacterium]|nr:DedA family protein [Campylobacterota bacterium]
MLLAFSLFITSFLAATILPFSSEVALYTALEKGLDPFIALLSASLGNVSAIILNYYLGYFLYEKTKTKLLSSKTGRKAYSYAHQYGYWALLLSWLPIIGDPITLVAGIFKLHFIKFIIIAGFLRILRYFLIILLFNSIF